MLCRNQSRIHGLGGACILAWGLWFSLIPGCGEPDYRQLRLEGQRACLNDSYYVGRSFFKQAELKRHRRDADNLHDLGACSVMVAKQKFKERNYAAAMREVDEAIAHYTEAVDMNPGHQASIEGKSVALELKGQFDEALKNAEWAAEFVGPSARQFVWLGRELEKRGDPEAALLRYQQAVSVEPRNASAHSTLADFLLRHENKSLAIVHLETAYRLNPRDQWVSDKLRALGRTDIMLNRTGAAITSPTTP